jgi:hypothetical protein
MLALHPTFVSNTTSITNDALATFVGALLIWLLLHPQQVESLQKKQKFFKRYPDFSNRPDIAFGLNPGDSENPGTKKISTAWFRIALIGITLGAAFITKHNLMPFAALALFVLWLEKKFFTSWLQQAAIVIVIALLVFGWYYWHNFQQYGNWLAINPGVETEFSALIWDWPRWAQVIRNYNWSFWCAFGRTYQIHLPAWFYLIFFLPLTLLILYGAGRAVLADKMSALQSTEALPPSFPRREVTLFFVFGFFIYVIAALGYTASYPLNCAWGKYLFPLLIPIWALMLSALHAAVGQKFLKFLVVFLAMSFIFMNTVMVAQTARLHN